MARIDRINTFYSYVYGDRPAYLVMSDTCARVLDTGWEILWHESTVLIGMNTLVPPAT